MNDCLLTLLVLTGSDYGLLYSYTKAAAEKMILNANNTYVCTDIHGKPKKLIKCALRPLPTYGESYSETVQNYVVGFLRIARKMRGVLPVIG